MCIADHPSCLKYGSPGFNTQLVITLAFACFARTNSVLALSVDNEEMLTIRPTANRKSMSDSGQSLMLMHGSSP